MIAALVACVAFSWALGETLYARAIGQKASSRPIARLLAGAGTVAVVYLLVAAL